MPTLPSSSPLRIGIAGFGALGQRIAQGIDERPEFNWQLATIGVRDPQKVLTVANRLGRVPRVVPLAQVADEVDLVVECTNAQSLADVASITLSRGRSLVVVSIAGVLMDHHVEAMLRDAAHRVLFPSGAIGGLDAVRALRWQGIEYARLTTRKPPAALRGVSETAPHGAAWQVFQGNAREAAKRFPQNLNVAAALALAGAGSDRTQVEVWADPALNQNVHQIEVRGPAGSFTCELRAQASANVSSSSIAADSVLSLLASRCGGDLCFCNPTSCSPH